MYTQVGVWNPTKKSCNICGCRTFTEMDVELDFQHKDLYICDSCHMIYAQTPGTETPQKIEQVGFLDPSNYYNIVITKRVAGEILIHARIYRTAN